MECEFVTVDLAYEIDTEKIKTAIEDTGYEATYMEQIKLLVKG